MDVRIDAFVPANAPTSEVPQKSHTWMDLGRPIISALPAANTVPPGGTVGPRRNTGNRESLKDGVFCARTWDISKVSVHFRFATPVDNQDIMRMRVRRGVEHRKML